MTGYAVLKFGGAASWSNVCTVEARSSDAAIQSVAEQGDPEQADGIYVAIPLRSWKPLKVAFETKRQIKTSAAELVSRRRSAEDEDAA